MRVKTAVRFHDLESDRIREIGEIFTVQKGRGEKLIQLGFVKEFQVQKKEKKQTAEQAVIFMPEGNKLPGDTGAPMEGDTRKTDIERHS